jgi:plastocyanin
MTSRQRLLLSAALLAAAGGGAAPGQNPKLFGKVGPGYVITLTNASGARVTSVEPGTYDIEVEDLSEEHDFHLTGAGVDEATSVGGTGKQLWTVTLTSGRYSYVCDPHSTLMRGSFTVGISTSPPPPTPPSSGGITPKTKLVLTSGPAYSITLKTAAGKAVKTMKKGTYTMVVRDRSAIHNAHLVAPGYNRKTSPLSYVGTQTWKVRLAKAGTLRFLCDPHASSGMKGSARIVA